MTRRPSRVQLALEAAADRAINGEDMPGTYRLILEARDEHGSLVRVVHTQGRGVDSIGQTPSSQGTVSICDALPLCVDVTMSREDHDAQRSAQSKD